MVVCQCERISHRRIAKAVRSGCASLRDVCQETGAGRGCGGCVSSVRRLIEEHAAARPAMEVPDEAA